ncbi:MAG: hypothetical protein ACREP3_07870 [Candidatus Binatia bacterium]
MPARLHAHPAAVASSRQAAIDVVKAYLQATRARDFDTAYGYISSVDRGVRDKNTYLRSQESFKDFALDLAKSLAANTEVWLIQQKSGSSAIQLEIGYRALTADEISSQLFDWDPEKLNALSATQQSALLKGLSKLKRSEKMITFEGRETFELMREKEGWKIFLDWQSQHRVQFKSAQPRPRDLAVKFLRNDLLVKSEEPFQVDFKVTNRSPREIVVKVNHLFEPRKMEKSIDMIACGSLAPLRLLPYETREISSAYLVRGALPVKVPFAIIYDFNLARAPQKRLSQWKGAMAR